MFVCQANDHQEGEPHAVERVASCPVDASGSHADGLPAGYPRRRQGTRFPLAAILALAVAAILSNHLSVLAIAPWGADQAHDLLRALGFPDGVTPHPSTLQRLFGKRDPTGWSTALTDAFAMARSSSDEERPRGSQGVAIDGKAQRGRLAFATASGSVHARAAFVHEHGIVLAHEPIAHHEATANAEAELTVAPALLQRSDWHGRVLTGDARFGQRTRCEHVVAAGGDYLRIVNENQPTLHEDIRLLFDPPGACPSLDDRRETRTIEHGHGRTHDPRHLIASTDLVGSSDWPHLAQVFRLERTWRERGHTKHEVHSGITSLPPAIADAPRLLALQRGHWPIENRLNDVNGVTFGEDRSLIHRGNGPSVMAILRDRTLSLLRPAGHHAIAARLRYYSRHPDQAIALVTANHLQNA